VTDKPSLPSPPASPTWSPDAPEQAEALPEAPRASAPEERFQLLTLLGQGGMGEVWRARDLDLGRTVALKIMRGELPPSHRARFLYEARTTAGLDHPGIVAVHEVGLFSDGRPYYAMREVRGTTLREHIRQLHEQSTPVAYPPPTEELSLRRLIEAYLLACEAVAYAHAREIIHRDLKPENIMLGRFGAVLVVDWGLVRVVTDSSLEEVADPMELLGRLPGGRTRQGQAAGTPGYMPPEQARGELDRLSPASDVYALGAILACILCGSDPSPTGADAELLALPRVPPELRELVYLTMQPEIADRPRDALALGEQVRSWLDRSAALAEGEARQQALEDAFLGLPPELHERCQEQILSLVDADGATIARPAEQLDAESVELLVGVGILSRDGGLLRLADPAVERWPRLRGWLAADREGQRLRHELSVASRGWQERGRGLAGLWSSDQLARVRAWREVRRPWLAPIAQDFLHAGEARSRVRRLQLRLLSLGTSLVLILLVFGSAYLWREAQTAAVDSRLARKEAMERSLREEAARARLQGKEHVALALEAAWADSSGETSALSLETAARIGPLWLIPTEAGSRLAWSASGSRLAVLGPSGALLVLDPATRSAWRREGVRELAWSPTDSRLAMLDEEGRLSFEPPLEAEVADRWPGARLAWPAQLLVRSPEALSWFSPETGQVLTRPLRAPTDERISAQGDHRWWEERGALRVVALAEEEGLRLRTRGTWTVFGFLSDLDRLWLGDKVGAVRIFDRAGEMIAEVSGRGSDVTVASASPGGQALAVGGLDSVVRILSLVDGAPLLTFQEHDRPVRAIAWHPDGSLLATGGVDDEVILWEAEGPRSLATLGGLESSVLDIAFSPRGQDIAILTEQELMLWTPARLPEASLPACPSRRASLTPDGRLLLLEGTESSCVTDLLTGRSEAFPLVKGLEQEAGGELIGVRDGALVTVDLEQGATLREPLPGLPTGRLAGLFAPPEGTVVAVDELGSLSGTGPDGAWALNLGDWAGALEHRTQERYATAIDPRGDLYAVDLSGGRIAARVDEGMVSRLHRGWSIEGDSLLVGDHLGRIREWRLDVDRPSELVHTLPDPVAISALTRRDGRLAVGDAAGSVHLLEADGALSSLRLPGDSIATSLSLSPDGARLLVGMNQAALAVYDLASGRPLRIVDRGRRGLLHSLAWYDDEHVLGIGPEDAWIWKLPAEAPTPHTLTNLRVCRQTLAVVVVPHPDQSPWAPEALCLSASMGLSP
jgi:hypothetical protein